MGHALLAAACLGLLATAWGAVAATPAASPAVTPMFSQKVLRVGVFAYRPKPQTQARWRPLADYLTAALPGHRVDLEAMTLAELEQAIPRNRLDFVFTNPTHYIRLREGTSFSGALATLVELGPAGMPTSALGGVILARADHPGIERLADLDGRTVAIAGQRFLGAYYAPVYELVRAGLAWPRGARLLELGEPQDRVVEAVLAGRADAGFVRTGVLEGMARDRGLDLSQIDVLSPQTLPGFPFRVSTHIYPEWPFVALGRADPDLARRVAAALLAIRPEDPVARACAIGGFTVPADYGPVADLARTLRLPPYDGPPQFDLADVWGRWRWSILAGLALAALALALGLRLIVVNRRLQASRAESERRAARIAESEQALRASERRFRTMLEWTYSWEYWVAPDGRIRYSTPSCERITGWPAEALTTDPGFLETLIHPEDLPRWREHLAQELRPDPGSEGPGELDLRLRRRQGNTCWIRHVCHPVRDETGHYLGRRVSVRDITERRAAEERIHRLAYCDTLTGLANRRLFLDRLEQAIPAAARDGHLGAVLLIDLDHFKTLNDTAGHDVGDRVLVQAAETLRARLRREDTLARWGGDELIALLPRLGPDPRHAAAAAARVARKLRDALHGLEQLHPGAPRVAASIGVTLFGTGLGSGLDTGPATPDLLIKRADLALYRAKRAGRDTLRIHAPELAARPARIPSNTPFPATRRPAPCGGP